MSIYGDYVTTIMHDQKAADLRAEAARDHLAHEAKRNRRHVPGRLSRRVASGRATTA